MAASNKRARPHGPQEYRGNGNHDWEAVIGRGDGEHTLRLRVPGGWLYRIESVYDNMAVVFLPVPEAVGYAV